MAPVLVDLSGLGLDVVVRSYSTFLVVAALAALVLATRAVGRLGIGRRAALGGLLAALVAGLVGARLGSVILDAPAFIEAPGDALEVAPRHFALYGGLAGGALAMALAGRRWRVPFAALADAAVVPVAVGIALVRVGCFLNGCCAGVESELPWAVTFPEGSAAWEGQVARGGLGALLGHVDAVHPTQLYEAAVALTCAALATAAGRRWTPAPARRPARPSAPAGPTVSAGTAALVFAASFLAFRVLNQLLRPAAPDGLLPPPALVTVYAVAAAAAAAWLATRLRERSAAPLPAAPGRAPTAAL